MLPCGFSYRSSRLEYYKLSDAIDEGNESLFLEGYDKLFAQCVAALDAAARTVEVTAEENRVKAMRDFRRCVIDSGDHSSLLWLPLPDSR